MNARWAASMSVGAGIVVLALKWVAYRITGSVALYSDALESIINVVAAAVALLAIRISARPPDADHPYGHTKAEYFSAVLEGTLIALAAIAIVHAAWVRLLAPTPLARLDVGLAVSVGASLINALVAAMLVRVGKRVRSPALRADGLHLWTDVATSAGVFVGTALAGLTKLWIIDPLLAMLVAANIVRVGVGLVRDSVGGLMDEAVPAAEADRIRGLVVTSMAGALEVHAFKTRRAGTSTFVEFHLIVPGSMSVKAAHEICDRIEDTVETGVPGAHVTIHVEPEGKSLGAPHE